MLTEEQIALLNSYLSKVNILKEYTQTTSEPVTWKGKIINISQPFAYNSLKTLTIDIPLEESQKTQSTDMENTSSESPSYTTRTLRTTIKLDDTNIKWLLENEDNLNLIANAFFETVKNNYLLSKQVPQQLSQFVGKTF